MQLRNKAISFLNELIEIDGTNIRGEELYEKVCESLLKYKFIEKTNNESSYYCLYPELCKDSSFRNISFISIDDLHQSKDKHSKIDEFDFLENYPVSLNFDELYENEAYYKELIKSTLDCIGNYFPRHLNCNEYDSMEKYNHHKKLFGCNSITGLHFNADGKLINHISEKDGTCKIQAVMDMVFYGSARFERFLNILVNIAKRYVLCHSDMRIGLKVIYSLIEIVEKMLLLGNTAVPLSLEFNSIYDGNYARKIDVSDYAIFKSFCDRAEFDFNHKNMQGERVVVYNHIRIEYLYQLYSFLEYYLKRTYVLELISMFFFLKPSAESLELYFNREAYYQYAFNDFKYCFIDKHYERYDFIVELLEYKHVRRNGLKQDDVHWIFKYNQLSRAYELVLNKNFVTDGMDVEYKDCFNHDINTHYDKKSVNLEEEFKKKHIESECRDVLSGLSYGNLTKVNHYVSGIVAHNGTDRTASRFLEFKNIAHSINQKIKMVDVNYKYSFKDARLIQKKYQFDVKDANVLFDRYFSGKFENYINSLMDADRARTIVNGNTENQLLMLFGRNDSSAYDDFDLDDRFILDMIRLNCLLYFQLKRDKKISDSEYFRKYDLYKDACILVYEYTDWSGIKYQDYKRDYFSYFVEMYKAVTDDKINSFLKINEDKYRKVYNNADKQRKVLQRFFENAPESEYNDVNREIDFIFKNEKLRIALISSQLFKEDSFDTYYENNVYSGFYGDFTFVLVGFIKSMERFLKEVVIQIFNRRYKEYKLEGDADYLYYMESDNWGNPKKCFLDMGKCAISVAKGFEKSRKKGDIFHFYSWEDGKKTTEFYEYFVNKIRNGHLHVHMINDANEAEEMYRKVSYYFRKAIDEFLDNNYDSLN